VLARQAAAAVSVGTCWPWETVPRPPTSCSNCDVKVSQIVLRILDSDYDRVHSYHRVAMVLLQLLPMSQICQ